jgi:hypothetical protein
VERIPLEGWEGYEGHLRRYRWAAGKTERGERVADVACGIGYGATFFPHASIYHGYDKKGVPCPGEFPGMFHEEDIDDPAWAPLPSDVTCCFETLEHVADPGHLAKVLMASAARAIFVSVPVIETTWCNPFHRTDFTRADIPPLFDPWVTGDEWAQPDEHSHVWMFCRA